VVLAMRRGFFQRKIRGHRTEDGGQKTEDGGQRTEDRGQRAEVRA